MSATQFPPIMTKPSEMLEDLLTRNGIEKTELGRWISKPYLTVLRWTQDKGFDEDNQELVLRALRKAKTEGRAKIEDDLSDDHYFSHRAQAARKAKRANRMSVVALFENTTKVGRTVTEQERAALVHLDERIHLDVELCEALVLSMRGKLRESPEAAAENQRRIRSVGKKRQSPGG